MDLAAVRLRDTDDTVSAIARSVGYTSEYAFNRPFTRARHIPPGRYRTHSRATRPHNPHTAERNQLTGLHSRAQIKPLRASNYGMPAPPPAESPSASTAPGLRHALHEGTRSGPSSAPVPRTPLVRKPRPIVFGKRYAFRTAFRGFEVAKVVAMTEPDVDRLVREASISATVARSRPLSIRPAR